MGRSASLTHRAPATYKTKRDRWAPGFMRGSVLTGAVPPGEYSFAIRQSYERLGSVITDAPLPESALGAPSPATPALSSDLAGPAGRAGLPRRSGLLATAGLLATTAVWGSTFL